MAEHISPASGGSQTFVCIEFPRGLKKTQVGDFHSDSVYRLVVLRWGQRGHMSGNFSGGVTYELSLSTAVCVPSITIPDDWHL